MDLLAKLDRISSAASHIRDRYELSCEQTENRPFTKALDTSDPLDLFRQGTNDEARLLIRTDASTSASAAALPATTPAGPIPEVSGNAIARVPMVMATPLRKSTQPGFRQQREEPNPLVLYRSALKYIDMYANARDMTATHARILASYKQAKEKDARLKQLQEELDKVRISSNYAGRC
jgi:hypothetical protein